jgi:hypothetical protein
LHPPMSIWPIGITIVHPQERTPYLETTRVLSVRNHSEVEARRCGRGINRVNSSRLVDMANALHVEIPYFPEMSAAVERQTPSMLMNAKKLPKIGDEQEPMLKRETLELVRAYYRTTDPVVRKRLADLTRAVAKSETA